MAFLLSGISLFGSQDKVPAHKQRARELQPSAVLQCFCIGSHAPVLRLWQIDVYYERRVLKIGVPVLCQVLLYQRQGINIIECLAISLSRSAYRVIFYLYTAINIAFIEQRSKPDPLRVKRSQLVERSFELGQP